MLLFKNNLKILGKIPQTPPTGYDSKQIKYVDNLQGYVVESGYYHSEVTEEFQYKDEFEIEHTARVGERINVYTKIGVPAGLPIYPFVLPCPPYCGGSGGMKTLIGITFNINRKISALLDIIDNKVEYVDKTSDSATKINELISLLENRIKYDLMEIKQEIGGDGDKNS